MRRIPWLALLALLPGVAAAGEKEDPRAIVERAIKAHGGADALTKALNSTRTDTGAQDSVGREVSFVSSVTRSLPDRVRLKIEVDKKLTATYVLDGSKGWQQEGEGPSTPLPAARVKEMREEAYLWWVTTLVPLTKPGFTLTALPKVKIDGEPAVGVKVSRKGHTDTKLYFYERNGLLAKAERRTPEGGTMVDKEYLYGGFKEFGGVTLPTREVVNVNGRKYTSIAISNYAFPAKFDAGTFARP
jgi:hypothetical protein